jgi:Tfp pilus assembly protein PilX
MEALMEASMKYPMIRNRRPMASPSRERGVVLMIALIVLVAMTLAGLGIIRTIDTGTLVAGNIGYRQSALAGADNGAETALTWLTSNRTILDNDSPLSGYYASRQDALDITGNKTNSTTDGVDWGGSDPSIPVKAFHAGVDTSGNDVYYIINRLCAIPGSVNDPGQSCSKTTQTANGSTQGSPCYGCLPINQQQQIYYRITVRSLGVKNTVSYTQTIVVI